MFLQHWATWWCRRPSVEQTTGAARNPPDQLVPTAIKGGSYWCNYVVTLKLVHAFITARLDYRNSILYGLPKRLIQRLQRIQNTAARLVTRTNRDDHITPVLKGLHWLPVQERIMFKILLLTYKTIHGTAPSYLSELVSSYTPSRSLRSSSTNLLCRRKTKLLQYGGRSFFSAAPKLWNELPDSVRKCESLDVFKSALKKHLFCNAYL